MGRSESVNASVGVSKNGGESENNGCMLWEIV